MKKDYYELLGIEKTASQDEIKKAFRKKAMEYHPDKNNGDDTKFKEINEAYSVLSDEKKRQNYDNFGSADGGAGFGGAQGFGGFDFSQAQGFGGQGFEFDLGDIFGDMFGGGSRTKRNESGQDIQIELNISFEESVLGVEKKIRLEKDILCDNCHGTGAEKDSKIKKCDVCGGAGSTHTVQNTPFGQIQRQQVCEKCKGKGEIPEKLCSVCNGNGVKRGEEKIDIHIPAGVEDGQRLRVSGKGYEKADGQNGDLYIYISVEHDSRFKRVNNDLFVQEEISFSTAVLGGEKNIKAIAKDIKIKIPAGIQCGEKLKIRGEGVQGRAKGDLYVEIKVSVPKKLSRAYKKLVEELKKEEN